VLVTKRQIDFLTKLITLFASLLSFLETDLSENLGSEKFAVVFVTYVGEYLFDVVPLNSSLLIGEGHQRLVVVLRLKVVVTHFKISRQLWNQ